MKRTRNYLASTGALVFAFLATLGCNDAKRPAAAAPKPIDPQASFERIVENLRYYLDQLQVQPITEVENGSFSDFRLSRDVTAYECIPPAEAGGDYRGKITVAIRWSHSFRPPPNQTHEKSDEQKEAQQQADQEQSAEDAIRDGIEVLDSEAVADLKPGPKISSALAPHVMGKNESEEELRTFQLVFRDKRWELKEEPKTEGQDQGTSQGGDAEPTSNHQSVDNALARALKLQ